MDTTSGEARSRLTTVFDDLPFRLGVATALITFAMGVYARSAAPRITQTPLISSSGRDYYLLALGIVAGVALGCYWLRDARAGHAAGWLLPALAQLGSLLLVGVYHRWAIIVAVAMLAGSAVYVSLLTSAWLGSGDEIARASARLTHVVLTFGIALVNFSTLTLHRAGVVFTTCAVALVAFATLRQYFDGVGDSNVRCTIYIAVVSLAMAEVAWPLEYWRFTGWYGGAVLVVVFAFLSHLVDMQLRSALTRAAVVRSAGATTLLFAAVTYLATM